jgi:hypothetical protein
MSGTRTAIAVAATAAVAALALRELRSANTSPGATPNCAAGPLAEVSRQLSQVSSALNNAVQSLASLPSQIESQVNAAINSALSTAIGPVRTQANAIANELNQLLQFLNDPARFLAQWINMQTLFPNLDLRSLVNRLLSGLGVCAASNSPPPSTNSAVAGPTPNQQAQPPQANSSPNTSVVAQGSVLPIPVTVQPLSGPQPSSAANALNQIRFQESARLEVQRYRLELERSFTFDPNERQRLQSEIDDIRDRLSSLQRSSS